MRKQSLRRLVLLISNGIKQTDMKKILLSLTFLVAALAGYAQLDPSKITIGGGVGLQFGDYTLVNIAPQVGYNISPYVNAGAGFTYTHYGRKYDYSSLKETNNYLGFNVYGAFYPIPYIVLKVQPEINRMWQTIKERPSGAKETTEEFMFVCLVGGGVRLGPVTAMIQYDVAQNKYSPYGDKVFYSVGYTFGF